MSNNLLNTLKLSGSILGIYSLSLIIPSTADAQINISKATGTTSYANGFVSGNGWSGKEAGSVAESKANEIATTSRRATIRAAQALQSNLDETQTTYNNASALVQNLSQSASTPPPPIPTADAVRFTRVVRESSANCGCKNPEIAAATPPQPDNSAALAAAKAAQAKAAAELAQAQAQARQFLASAQKAAQVPAQNTGFSPLW